MTGAMAAFMEEESELDLYAHIQFEVSGISTPDIPRDLLTMSAIIMFAN